MIKNIKYITYFSFFKNDIVNPSFWPNKRAFLFRLAGADRGLWRGCSHGPDG